MKHVSSGFTLIEVVVAIVVLGIGIVGLVGASSSITRMIGRGKMETRAALAASRRMEILRAAAANSPRCTDPTFATGGPAISAGITETWQVPASGKVRPVRVTVTYLTGRGIRTAQLETRVTC